MDSATFLVMIQKRATRTNSAADPLKEAQKFIDEYGSTGEGQALRRVVEALWTGKGDFSESDLASFSAKSLALIPALVNTRIEGRYSEWQWHRASCHPPWRFLLDLHKKLDP